MNDPQQLLLEEYKVTQDVISHYERLIWQIGSALNASVVLLAGIVVTLKEIRHFWLVPVISAMLSTVWFLFEARYRRINLIKFRRLWELESQLGFRQNLAVKEYDEMHKPILRGHHLIAAFSFGLPIMLFVFWLAVKP